MTNVDGVLLTDEWSGLLFLGCVCFVTYTYIVYPVAIAFVSALWPRPVRRSPGFLPSISIVLAMKDEADHVRRRVEDLLALDYPEERLQVVAVSDGSTDETAHVVRELAALTSRVVAVTLEENVGKAAALNHGVSAARGDLVVFADARQSFAPNAVKLLAEAFSDPSVGSVSGELQFRDEEEGIAEPIGWYWRYEKWIRASESLVASMLGATGAIYAIRREAWSPLSPGLVLDDFLVPMRIVLSGKRAVFDRRAIAFDQRSRNTQEEFARKVRTLAGNFQAFAVEPGLLLPWRNPTTWIQVWSHKVFRLLVPFALAIMFVTSLISDAQPLLAAFVAQAAFYALALAGLLIERVGRHVRLRIVSFPLMFVTMQFAALAGLWAWIVRPGLKGVWQTGAARNR